MPIGFYASLWVLILSFASLGILMGPYGLLSVCIRFYGS